MSYTFDELQDAVADEINNMTPNELAELLPEYFALYSDDDILDRMVRVFDRHGVGELLDELQDLIDELQPNLTNTFINKRRELGL